jgi:hypothetical protein
MRHTRCLANSAILVSVLILASTRDAHAYIDPGTGSYVAQLIIAALVGAGVAVKIYWGKIKAFFGASSKGQEKEQDG